LRCPIRPISSACNRLTSPTTEREETVLFLDTVEGPELLNDLRARGYVVEARFR